MEQDKFNNKEELVEYIYDMYLQNLNGREEFDEAFKIGIENTLDELEELNFLNLFNVGKRLYKVYYTVYANEELICLIECDAGEDNVKRAFFKEHRAEAIINRIENVC